MYLNDSGPAATYAFDFDAESGAIDRQRVLIQHDDGVGDGLTMDAEGCLWIPLWGGAAVDRYDPDGRRMLRIPLPVPQPSACCLADGVLYVTTAYKGRSDPQPDEGRIFAVDVGVTAPGVQRYCGNPRPLSA